ncbi:centromere protein Chl4/mis15/CENP-N [Calycina marina]|uniref:Centromere protein Chl4/mis15/CENP-N n=1 Tax=Calycina marina TaxID=1763456 RepID=A0A9P8CFT0_9HELO|nr:centromere protein Chl4/mis15/CENP-N [Calycina marina]
MDSFTIPTTSSLPATQLLPSNHPSIAKALHRLSRPSLLSLCLDWLDERNLDLTAPYILEDGGDEDNDLYPGANSLQELRDQYTETQKQKGSKRDVVDRILEGDWRDGLTLYQMAMVDMQYLYDHPTSQKWTALKIVPLSSDEGRPNNKTALPRFHPATFLQNLQREVLPDVKAHYNLDRHAHLPLYILRVYIVDSPYNTSLALTANSKFSPEASRTFYVAFPDNSPHIYISLTTTSTTSLLPTPTSDNKSLRKLVLCGIPKAFSRPRERYTLEPTRLSARNLEVLSALRGGGRTNNAAGGWGVYAGDDQSDNPLRIVQLPTPEQESETEDTKSPAKKGLKRRIQPEESLVKRRKLLAQGRFGNSAKEHDGMGIERVDLKLEDRYSIISDSIEGDGGDAEDWRPDTRVTFNGTHVFAGIRQLVEQGIIDGEKMPGWMTGEDGFSFGIVRDGRFVDGAA